MVYQLCRLPARREWPKPAAIFAEHGFPFWLAGDW
jgi:hypothetical protein